MQPAIVRNPDPGSNPAATSSAGVGASPSAAVMVSTSATLGQYLADSGGMTLYYLAKDSPANGTRVCTGACIATWPAFTTPAGAVGSSLSASDFSQVTRADGTMQTTYKGWPLYYYKGDSAAGDTNGQGINGVWFVVSPTGPVTMAPTSTTAATALATMMPATPSPKPTTTSYSSGY